MLLLWGRGGQTKDVCHLTWCLWWYVMVTTIKLTSYVMYCVAVATPFLLPWNTFYILNVQIRKTFSGRFSSFCRATARPSAFDRHLETLKVQMFYLSNNCHWNVYTHLSRSIRWAMSFTCFSTSVNPYLFSMIWEKNDKYSKQSKRERNKINLLLTSQCREEQHRQEDGSFYTAYTMHISVIVIISGYTCWQLRLKTYLSRKPC